MSYPNYSSRSSTVISKTTPKVIAKTEMPRPKVAALWETRKDRAGEIQATALDPPPKSAWGSTRSSAIGTPRFTEVIAREVATQAQSSEIYQKLARPSGLSVAANDLSLRRHQAIGNIFDNGSQAAEQSQQSTFKCKERSYDSEYSTRATIYNCLLTSWQGYMIDTSSKRVLYSVLQLTSMMAVGN